MIQDAILYDCEIIGFFIFDRVIHKFHKCSIYFSSRISVSQGSMLNAIITQMINFAVISNGAE